MLVKISRKDAWYTLCQTLDRICRLGKVTESECQEILQHAQDDLDELEAYLEIFVSEGKLTAGDKDAFISWSQVSRGELASV